MPDDTGGSPQAGQDTEQGQAPSTTQDGTSQEDGASNTDDGTTAQDTGQQDMSSLPEWAQQQLRATRQEAAAYRTQLREREREDMSDLDQARTDAQEANEKADRWRTQAQRLAVQEHARTAATRLQYRMPSIAHRLVDLDAVEWDDAGIPTNLDVLLRREAEQTPELVTAGNGQGAGGQDVTAGGPAGSGFDMNQAIRHAAGRA